MRLSTAEKLQRLISIVAWINGREDGATLDEVCTRFDISRGELVAQLEMANMIGAESEDYTDMPVDVTFEGDVVRVSGRWNSMRNTRTTSPSKVTSTGMSV